MRAHYLIDLNDLLSFDEVGGVTTCIDSSVVITGAPTQPFTSTDQRVMQNLSTGECHGETTSIPLDRSQVPFLCNVCLEKRFKHVKVPPIAVTL
jgi:hypothetical protein